MFMHIGTYDKDFYMSGRSSCSVGQLLCDKINRTMRAVNNGRSCFFFFQLATEARWEAKLGRRQQRKLQCCKCSRIAFVVASV